MCAINLMCATCVALITSRVWFGALFVATGKTESVPGFVHGFDFLEAWFVLSRAGFGLIGFHARPLSAIKRPNRPVMMTRPQSAG